MFYEPGLTLRIIECTQQHVAREMVKDCFFGVGGPITKIENRYSRNLLGENVSSFQIGYFLKNEVIKFA